MVEWDCGKNYYKVLGVDPKASLEDIRDRYIKLSRENHTDLNQAAYTYKMSEINEAYNIVGDKVTRALYDRFCILDFDDDIDIEEDNSKKNFLSRIKDGYIERMKDNSKEEENIEYSAEYQRVVDCKSAIYDQITMEIQYVKGFDEEVRKEKIEILDTYDCDRLAERLSMPFYKRALKLAYENNLNLKKDKKYCLLYNELTTTLYKVLYRLSRIIECNSYTVLYDSSKEEYYDMYIEKIESLYAVIFELMGMSSNEAYLVESYFNIRKDLPKHEKRILKLRYEVSGCYVSYKKLTDKLKKRQYKALIKK